MNLVFLERISVYFRGNFKFLERIRVDFDENLN